MENHEILKALYRIIELQENTLTELKRRSDQSQTLASKSDEDPLDRLEVMEYLRISKATYKRKVSQGKLNPMVTPGGHLYYKSDLDAEYRESVRRGRV